MNMSERASSMWFSLQINDILVGYRITGSKAKKAGSCSMIESMTCRILVDFGSYKDSNEMNENKRNKLVFDCWKGMADKKLNMVNVKVKIADVNVKMEEEIERLKGEIVSQRSELEEERKVKGGKN
ncbi:hypothetical protein FHG87_025060 [Trinorchestia longiramus]|nr:hypothetical protein FHG87_025060 [Trinorchestia longiramus]